MESLEKIRNSQMKDAEASNTNYLALKQDMNHGGYQILLLLEDIKQSTTDLPMNILETILQAQEQQTHTGLVATVDPPSSFLQRPKLQPLQDSSTPPSDLLENHRDKLAMLLNRIESFLPGQDFGLLKAPSYEWWPD
ncbi:hypothetical protein BP6252_08667 [Coleophoma cylindrospora]|uniref:Uncharacterized protein n=1 Tax=Coleophoma cylindrospora TaxID=1849047 RepID=A0A3D8R6M5_9HELO|nr:hypothetical protein BP6252_08667 [Coleophoma cylindrospora]